MKIFVAASYSAKVDYDTGKVFSHYREWLEGELKSLEEIGHEIFCALREDNYEINNEDPAAAFRLDLDKLKSSDLLLAYVSNEKSVGVQTEVGIAIGIEKTGYLG